jgi:hypothetical protein
MRERCGCSHRHEKLRQSPPFRVAELDPQMTPTLAADWRGAVRLGIDLFAAAYRRS